MFSKLNFNDFNMESCDKKKVIKLMNHIKKLTLSEDYDEEVKKDRLDYYWNHLKWPLTISLIKNIENLRKYKEWLDWPYLSGYYEFTKVEELKELKDYLYWDNVTYLIILHWMR